MHAILEDRAIVRLSGSDGRSFLQGLVSQDAEGLQPGDLRYAALLTPQGRLRWDLFLFGEDEGVAIDAPAAARDELVRALTLYRLRAKVTITPADDPVAAAWGEPPGEDGWRVDPRLPDLGWRRLGPVSGPMGDYRAHRFALGVADPAEDAAEPLYPIEANLDLLHGIDFKKGCFVGQETTSRMKRRGQVKSRIAPLAHDGPALTPGAEVLAGELRAGWVLAGMDGRSLALLRIDRAVGQALAVEGRAVRLDLPAWLEPAFALAATEA